MNRSSALVVAIFLMSLYPAEAVAQRMVELPARDRTASIELQDVYAIGGLDAPNWAAFGARLALAFDPDGRLLVLDSDNHRLLVVGRDGRLAGEVGREGAGPGEFRLPVDVAALPDGSIVVLDRLRRRFIQFDGAGDLITDASAAIGQGMPRAIFPHPERGVVGDAFIYQADGRPSARTAAGIVPVEGRPVQHYLLADDDARLLHSARERSRATAPGGRIPLAAFFPEFRMTVLPDGRAAVSDTGAYILTVLRPDGGIDRILRRPAARRAVTDAMRDRERQRLLANLAEGRPPESVVSFGGNPPSREELEARFKQRIGAMVFPDSLPAVLGLRADAEGRIWIARSGPDPRGPGPIDIVTGDGAYLGTVPAGRGELPVAFGPGGLAAYITLDELDVPTIHVRTLRLRLADSGGGG